MFNEFPPIKQLVDHSLDNDRGLVELACDLVEISALRYVFTDFKDFGQHPDSLIPALRITQQLPNLENEH